MRQNISVINNPIIDILIAVASWGGVENCINMVGKYLCEKGFRVRVIQMVYEGMYWVDDSMEFHYICSTRNDHDFRDFIDGYSSFLNNHDKPDMIIATGWPMMSYVAKRVCTAIGENITVGSWLHAPLQKYAESGYGGGEFIKCADMHFAISNEIAVEIRNFDSEGIIYRVNNTVEMSKIHVVDSLKPGTILFVGRLSKEKI